MIDNPSEESMSINQRGTVAEAYRSFSSRVTPARASAEQRRDMRRCFYAGAGSMYELMTNGLDGSPDATNLDLAYMISLQEEFIAFAKSVKDGKA